MKQSDVIAAELATAAPQRPWTMVNGWPMHCNQRAAVKQDIVLPAFVCVACGEHEYVLYTDLPAGDNNGK